VRVLVCVKRVAMVGARIVLTADEKDVEVRQLGFTISPHEECAVEEAVRIVEQRGGVVTVLTLGPPEAADQLRDAASIGANQLVHLVTDGREWDPVATAGAIVDAIRRLEAADGPYDLILLGNEAADTGDYQVGVRVAYALGRPCVNGVKNLHVGAESVVVKREFRGGDELYELAMPSVVAVKEGINLPRYPSLPGRVRAKKMAIDDTTLAWHQGPVVLERLRVPSEPRERAEILGTGLDAVAALVDLFELWGVVA
jgi:electron transfer flavoprotein beta subunit